MATPTAALTILAVSTWTNGVGTYPQPVPSAPTGLTATAVSGTQINLGVSAAPVAAVSTEWEFKLSSSGTWSALLTTPASTVSLNVTSLAAQQSYDFRARYVGLNGNSAYSATATASTITAPSVPVIASVTSISSTSLSIALSSFPANAATVNLQRSTSASFTSPTTFILTSPNTSYTDTGLTTSTTYYYRAAAVGPGGTSAYSSTMSGMPVAPTGIVDGGTFVMNGSGFGTNVMGQDFIGGVNGYLNTTSVGAVCAPPTWSRSDRAPAYISTTSWTGYRSYRQTYEPNTAYAFGIGRDTGGRIYSSYVRYNVRLDADHSVMQFKLQRLCSRDSVSDQGPPNSPNDNSTYLTNWWGGGAGNAYVESHPGGSNIYVTEARIGRGVWHQVQTWWVPDNPAGANNAEFGLRVINLETGSVLYSATQTGRNMWDGNNPFRWIMMQGYFGNMSGGSGYPSAYFDDVYTSWNASNTTLPKFILLGDASTYAACNQTLLSICPFISWNNTQIQLTINRGRHANLSNKYLYAMSGPNTPINSSGVPLV